MSQGENKRTKGLFSKYIRIHLIFINIFDRQIQGLLPYVDSTRTAIWGWSYGGYAAGMALASDTEEIFKCGISVAPVTDWTLYGKLYLYNITDNLAKSVILLHIRGCEI